MTGLVLITNDSTDSSYLMFLRYLFAGENPVRITQQLHPLINQHLYSKYDCNCTLSQGMSELFTTKFVANTEIVLYETLDQNGEGMLL